MHLLYMVNLLQLTPLNENQTDDKEEHIKELTFLNLIHNNIKNISDATQTEKKKQKFELNLKDNINQIETNYNNNFKKCLIENVLNSNKICNNDELNFNIAIKEKSIEYINQITQPLNKKLNNFLNFDENKYNELYNNEEDKNFYYNLLSNLQSYYQYKDFEENKTELTNINFTFPRTIYVKKNSNKKVIKIISPEIESMNIKLYISSNSF